MAYSKTSLFLALLFAASIVMSSQVSARELAEATQTQESVKMDSVEDGDHYGHGGGHHGRHYGHGGGHGGGGHYGHGDHHCHHGHCGHGDEETESNHN